MQSRDFCFWLQGYFEISATKSGLAPDKVEMIRNHLALVFKHEIDPSMGPKQHQNKLNEVHNPQSKPGDFIARC
jgi:hypothetical protein